MIITILFYFYFYCTATWNNMAQWPENIAFIKDQFYRNIKNSVATKALRSIKIFKFLVLPADFRPIFGLYDASILFNLRNEVEFN